MDTPSAQTSLFAPREQQPVQSRGYGVEVNSEEVTRWFLGRFLRLFGRDTFTSCLGRRVGHQGPVQAWRKEKFFLFDPEERKAEERKRAEPVGQQKALRFPKTSENSTEFTNTWCKWAFCIATELGERRKTKRFQLTSEFLLKASSLQLTLSSLGGVGGGNKWQMASSVSLTSP